MTKFLSHIAQPFFLLLLAACTADDLTQSDTPLDSDTDIRLLTGIRATIEHGAASAPTRAGTVTPLLDDVGRTDFRGGDRIVFTTIRRTQTPLDAFTYDGITFLAGEEGGWMRDENDNGPERVYWTDATNHHTFIAYSLQQGQGSYWKPSRFTIEEGGQKVPMTYYVGALGNPTLTGGANDTIDFSLTPAQQLLDENIDTVNNVVVYHNPLLEHEDIVISHNTSVLAEPGGSVASVKFHHALSSVRVIVNISGFSTGASATADNATVVSNMRLLHQPTMYVWKQTDWKAQPMNATIQLGEVLSAQAMIDSAWTNSGTTPPAFNQRKALKLWIPQHNGSGTNQSKTFTFYGITTPQPASYLSTLTAANELPYRNADLVFDVTYPDPMLPTTHTLTRTYRAQVPNCAFDAGYNTTINISLNHEDEQMAVGVEYENWQFVTTPDHSNLKKNSTFLHNTARDSVTIASDLAATADDATWLYLNGNHLLDIYGHTGDSKTDAYQISTAYQLLSLAYEVSEGERDFTGKFIRLDADLTLQPSTKTTQEETVKARDDQDIRSIARALDWIGIGDDTHPFNGTFLGGDRFIYRLKGRPLFAHLGSNAKVEYLQVNAITLGNSDFAYTVIDGNGLLANINDGKIFGCKVVGNVQLNGTTSGALTGTNTGHVFACYHIGDTQGTTHTGGLVGSNSGTIVGCYQAGKVTATTSTGGITADNTGTLNTNFYNSNLLTPTETHPEVTPMTSAQMTKETFVTLINTGLTSWRTTHPSDNYTNYQYIFHPANYPTIEEVTTP